MVTFLTAVLIISSLGMCALLYIKNWEMTTGRILFENIRPKVGNFSHRYISYIELHMPNMLRRDMQRLFNWVRASFVGAIARAVLLVEKGLEQVLYVLRRTTALKTSEVGEASIFLQEIAAHKKKLTRTVHRRIIVEE